LVFPCVIAFLRYLAYKYCCIPCFCTVPLRRVTVGDRGCLAVWWVLDWCQYNIYLYHIPYLCTLYKHVVAG
jgi:hypothetical protein